MGARTVNAGPDRRVAFLRGVNVGTAKRIAMADLRTIMEDSGYLDVRTVLNSGNIVFTVPRKIPADPAARIEKAIAGRLGVSTRVTVLLSSEVTDAVRSNPLASVANDPSRLLMMALRDPAAAKALKPLLEERWAPEAFALRKRIAYLWCANGIAESRLWTAANRALGDSGTARNLATMTKLMALLEDNP